MALFGFVTFRDSSNVKNPTRDFCVDTACGADGHFSRLAVLVIAFARVDPDTVQRRPKVTLVGLVKVAVGCQVFFALSPFLCPCAHPLSVPLQLPLPYPSRASSCPRDLLIAGLKEDSLLGKGVMQQQSSRSKLLPSAGRMLRSCDGDQRSMGD